MLDNSKTIIYIIPTSRSYRKRTRVNEKADAKKNKQNLIKRAT